jgi:tRNA dimethylallyltransferase
MSEDFYKEPVIVLAGPTGVGKTDLSILLAQKLNAEIISADSRQIYKQLNLGTAKPSQKQQDAIPHHFINIFDIDTSYSAGAFSRDASRTIKALLEKGTTPLIVGGSTLYLHALQFGLSDIPVVDKATRQYVIALAQNSTIPSLYKHLQDIDQESARKINPSNPQLIMRALEVYYYSGKPLSRFHSQGVKKPSFKFVTFVLNRERQLLYNRINERVDFMIRSGLVDEVRQLLRQWKTPELPGLNSIGYTEVISHLNGDIDETTMISLIKRNTRRYAKRQLTWFRRYSQYEWLDASTPAETISEYILNKINHSL